MNCVAAEIAIEIGVFLEYDDIHSGARQEEAGHHSGGSAADDNAAGSEVSWRAQRSSFNRLPARDAEAVEDGAGRVGFIEGVEMNSGYVVVEQIVTLLEREMNADPRDHFRIVLTTLERAQ